MSLLSGLNLTDDELQRASPTLRDRILEKYARIRGLQLIQTGQAFERDGQRLDAKARATYRKLGLDVSDKTDDDEIVLGDKVTSTVGIATATICSLALLCATAILIAALFAFQNSGGEDTDTDTKYKPGIGTSKPIE